MEKDKKFESEYIQKYRIWLDSDMFNIFLFDHRKDLNENCVIINESWFDSVNRLDSRVFEINSKYFHEERRKEIMKNKMNVFKKINSSKKRIIIPSCHNQLHWSLSILDLTINKLLIIDSFNSENRHNNLLNLLNQSEQFNNKITIQYVKVSLQTDAYTCGYRMIMYLKELFMKQSEPNYLSIKVLNQDSLNEVLNEMNVVINKIKSIQQYVSDWVSNVSIEYYNELYYDRKVIEQVYEELLQQGITFDEYGYLHYHE